MSPSKKKSLSSPIKESRSKKKHKKSKHKREKDKSNTKHSKSKLKPKSKHKLKHKHKHKKYRKGKYIWPMAGIHVQTLGELIFANCGKLSGVGLLDGVKQCDVELSENNLNNIPLPPSKNTSDIVIVYDSRKSCSLLGSDIKVSAKLGGSDTNSCMNDNVLCLEGENICTAAPNSDGSTLTKQPQLIDLTDDQHDTVSKTLPTETFGDFENHLKTTEASATDHNEVEKVVDVGLSPFQQQDLNIFSSVTKESRSGKCVDPGRYWIYSETMMEDTSKLKKFKLMSYNVLSQSLLEEHPYLYRKNDERALDWSFRSQLLFSEIKSLDADILCLQEVEYDHIDIFERQLQILGYRGIYKKRSHKRVDGVAIFYKAEVFMLQEYTSVEFFQPGVQILNRDNVALVAKLVHKDQPGEGIVVATTHLLFNMKRHDVKLAQTQLLLAEVERFAYAGIGKHGAQYLPVVITGDMNFKPNTGVYNFLTKGRLRYEGLSNKTLEKRHEWSGQLLNNTLLPRRLQITDSCQHWGILPLRNHGVPDHTEEIEHLKIHNSDFSLLRQHQSDNSRARAVKPSRLLETLMSKPGSSSQQTNQNSETEIMKIANEENVLPSDRFETGVLTHPFNFQSAYTDHDSEVTTFHDRWITVDYIFYSLAKDEFENGLTLLATYKLPTVGEATRLGRIPNFNSPSDHYPLLVMFGLDSETRKP